MKKRIMFLGIMILVTLVAGCIQKTSMTDEPKSLKKISGKVMQASDYCGGALRALSREEIDEIQKEKPFGRKPLYIRNETTNIVSNPIIKEFVSDDNGNFEILLPTGQYCIIEYNKKEGLRKLPQFIDVTHINTTNISPEKNKEYLDKIIQCGEDWWKTCDKILSVEKYDINNFIIKFHRSCQGQCIIGVDLPQ